MSDKKASSAEILSAQIRAGMEARGWTQADLASRIGTTQSDVSAILRGARAPGWAKVCKIARALRITITTRG